MRSFHSVKLAAAACVVLVLLIGHPVATFQAPGAPTNLLVVIGGAAAAYYTGTLRQPTCSSASISSAISSSQSGDIVRMASACASFTATISIPNTKGILFDGNGSTFGSGSTISVDPNSTKSTRITNFTLACSSSPTLTFSGTATSAPWRMDHVTLAGSSECIETNMGAGLMDHITAVQMQWANEFIHFLGAGDTNQSTNVYWQDAITPGQSGQVYLEDSHFQTPTSQAGFAELQSYYGARIVIRFNTFDWVELDAHGGGSGVAGTRWSEIYKNTFNGNPSSPGGVADSVRAGSGIWYGNTRNSSAPNSFGFCTEGSSPGPVNSQPGRGKNMVLWPAYSFLSTGFSNDVNSCSAVGLCPDCIQFNRDVYTDINSANCTAGGSCTGGVGSGTSLPTTCTVGTAFWKTDAGGNWDTTNGTANDGALYKCTSSNAFTQYYVPYTYPSPLQSSLNSDK
jgi:hypothetical protein